MNQPVEKRFKNGTTDLCYFEWGDPADQTIVMLHATGFHARCWDKVIMALPRGYHVIAVDTRGHGRSSKPDSLSDWQQTAMAAASLIDGLDLQQVVGVGHSMGGFSVVLAAAKHQERFERLVLVDPTITEVERYDSDQSPADVDPLDHPVSRRRNVWDSAQDFFDHLKDRSPYSLWKSEVLMDYCQYGLLPAKDGGHLELACPPRLEASVYMGFPCFNPYPLLPDVAIPMTILRAKFNERQSDMDFTNSPTWPGLSGVFPDARDIHLPELTHFMPMQEPELIAGYIAEG